MAVLLGGLCLIGAAFALIVLPDIDFAALASNMQRIITGDDADGIEPPASPTAIAGAYPTNTPIFYPTSTPALPPTNTPIRYPTNTPAPLPSDTPAQHPTNTPIRYPTSTPGKTASPTPAAGEWEPCAGSYPSRLHVGDRAYVSFDPPLANRVRARPDSDAVIEGTIDPGDKVKIIDGPVCADNWVWWKINAENEVLVGWTSEGDFEGYWLVPMPE